MTPRKRGGVPGKRSPKTPPRMATLRLEARAMEDLRPKAHWLCSQRAAADLIDVSTETIRTYVRRGLPEYGTPGQPQYDRREVVQWWLCWRSRQEEKARRGRRSQERVERITMADAWRWHLERQADREPSWFAIVPLGWDHPMRLEQLRKAAQGIEPSATPDDFDEEDL